MPSLPFIVAAVQPIELYFFQRVFFRLCERKGRNGEDSLDSEFLSTSAIYEEDMGPMESDESIEDKEVLLVEFQRAMARLFRVLRDGRVFNAAVYDYNGNGKVGWLEFCCLWKERPIVYVLSLPERIFITFDDSQKSILGKILSVVMFTAILISTGSFVLSTLPEMRTKCPLYGELGFDASCMPQNKPIFDIIDFACAMYFTFEYGIRLVLSAYMRTEIWDRDRLLDSMVSDEPIDNVSVVRRVIAFALQWCNLIDLSAILPWYFQHAMSSTGAGGTFISLIRLMRVVRAFRLARRFEAVIIIMRNLRRSMRAIFLLVLNLALGMLVFGSLLYFAEQGEWNPDTQAWERKGTDGIEKNPFESIPHCFWWAMVTATTVGYGDNHTPRTPPGKVVAGVTMVWSVCVLALPIGVIGTNFIKVWEEYDNEKKAEQDQYLHEDEMLKKSFAWGDPLHYSRRLLIEIWHDAGFPIGELGMQSEFMGEVDYRLTLTKDEEVSKKLVQAPVTTNFDKAHRSVRGQLTFEYSWQPTSVKDMDDGKDEVLLQGSLEVVVIKAENLISIDWKGSGTSDPFCVVVAHPNSPNKEDVRVLKKVENTTNPHWNATLHFDVNWTRSGADAGIMTDMLMTCGTKRASRTSRTSFSTASAQPRRPSITEEDALYVPDVPDVSHKPAAPLPAAEAAVAAMARLPNVKILRQSVPQLEKDIAELRRVVPQLHKEVASVRTDIQKILSVLARRDAGVPTEECSEMEQNMSVS
mmetsp:Transcript_100775/g.284190  ORF Transcript_100775/g.284190 Transcript_100775/m.284190 type:complete len:752 (-) Transcript_100775:195-2450(-)